MDGCRDCHTEWSKSEREGEIPHDIPYMWNLQGNDKNELTYKRGWYSHLREQTYGCQWEEWGEGIVREFGYRPVYTAIFKMGNQQGPTVQHRELCSMSCGSLDGREVWGRMDTCMAESLHSSPETITTMVTGYIPIQNKKFQKICF